MPIKDMTIECVLDTATKELGVKESPANSNNVKYNTWYYGKPVSGSSYPWCMVFVQWVFYMSHIALPARTASCTQLMKASKAAGYWYTSGYKPGDIVLYDFSGQKKTTEHCGIIESVTGSSVVAIEGNTSIAGSQSNGGEVCRKTRLSRYIVGVVRPKFAAVKKDDILDISKLTDDDIMQLANRIQSVLNKQSVSKTLAPELEKAKSLGITDGSNPCAFCTRAQSAIMTLRAMEKCKN